MNILEALLYKQSKINVCFSSENIAEDYLNIGFWPDLPLDLVFKSPIKNDGALLANFNFIEGLPFEDNSVSAAYQSRLISTRGFDILKLLNEYYRCLKNGGRLRIFEPDSTSLVKAFLTNHFSFDDLKIRDYVPLGEREGISFTQLLSSLPGLLFCDFEILESSLINAGFVNIKRSLFTSSNHFHNINILEQGSPFYFYHSLCIECEK
jgi:hypothetical protein